MLETSNYCWSLYNLNKIKSYIWQNQSDEGMIVYQEVTLLKQVDVLQLVEP